MIHFNFSEATGLPHDSTLPTVFEATEDPSINNLTRSDVNCDNKGYCYDGNYSKLTLSDRYQFFF